MSESIVAGLRPIRERILTAPTAEDVWQIQKDLLAIGGEAAVRGAGPVVPGVLGRGCGLC